MLRIAIGRLQLNAVAGAVVWRAERWMCLSVFELYNMYYPVCLPKFGVSTIFPYRLEAPVSGLETNLLETDLYLNIMPSSHDQIGRLNT